MNFFIKRCSLVNDKAAGTWTHIHYLYKCIYKISSCYFVEFNFQIELEYKARKICEDSCIQVVLYLSKAVKITFCDLIVDGR